MTQEINNVRIATFTLRLSDCEFITSIFTFGFLHALSIPRCLHAVSITRRFQSWWFTRCFRYMHIQSSRYSLRDENDEKTYSVPCSCTVLLSLSLSAFHKDRWYSVFCPS